MKQNIEKHRTLKSNVEESSSNCRKHKRIRDLLLYCFLLLLEIIGKHTIWLSREYLQKSFYLGKVMCFGFYKNDDCLLLSLCQNAISTRQNVYGPESRKSKFLLGMSRNTQKILLGKYSQQNLVPRNIQAVFLRNIRYSIVLLYFFLQ